MYYDSYFHFVGWGAQNYPVIKAFDWYAASLKLMDLVFLIKIFKPI